MPTSEFSKKILDVINKELGSKRNMQIIGDQAVDLIRLRSRLGKGVPKQGGQERAFTKLSEIYKKRRKVFAGLSSKTSPTKSNLTLTGSMLDSLFAKASEGKVTIAVQGELNELKASVHQLGSPPVPQRPFMALSGRQMTSIQRTIRGIVTKTLNRVFK